MATILSFGVTTSSMRMGFVEVVRRRESVGLRVVQE